MKAIEVPKNVPTLNKKTCHTVVVYSCASHIFSNLLLKIIICIIHYFCQKHKRVDLCLSRIENSDNVSIKFCFDLKNISDFNTCFYM